MVQTDDAKQALQALRSYPAADIRFGRAPDGLPWVLSINRVARITELHDAVSRVFGLTAVSDLPPDLADIVRGKLSESLTGLHEIELEAGQGSQTTYTSARSSGSILGSTLLARMLGHDGGTTPVPRPSTQLIVPGNATAANVGAAKSIAAAIAERRTSRRLVIPFEDERIWIGGVKHGDRALGRPSGPYRPLVLESLSEWRGARVRMQPELRPIDIDGPDVLPRLATQVRSTYELGWRQFEVPHATIVDALIALARALHEVHATGIIHGDLSPGNILFSQGRPVLIDSLDVPIGSQPAFATYNWASPEQILGRIVDARSEVFVLGKLLASTLGGVGYGQTASFTVPTGGRNLQTVTTTLVEGVFIDVSDLDVSHDWQESWCAFLSRCMDANADRRPASAAAFADEAEQLARDHPPVGWARFSPAFGEIKDADAGPWGTPFYLVRDGGWQPAERRTVIHPPDLL